MQVEQGNQFADASRPSNGLIQVENFHQWQVGDQNLTGAYGQCEGTWNEFLWDVKSTLANIKSDAADRVDTWREMLGNFFHRGRAAETPVRSRTV